jgi:hypothetical protein
MHPLPKIAYLSEPPSYTLLCMLLPLTRFLVIAFSVSFGRGQECTDTMSEEHKPIQK